MYLIMTDSYSKWPEVYALNEIDAINTVNKLRNYASRYGISRKIISDNGKQLDSKEFVNFCDLNDIKYPQNAPWHLKSNGAAENAVRSFKSGLKKTLLDPKNYQLGTNTLIARYLFPYRNTPYCYTGDSPAKLMFGRKLRTCFDLLKESSVIEKDKHKKLQRKTCRRIYSWRARLGD
ncbi:uncharacterized protein K02A2.6-like [Trichogramma pretiosum]|uniref:uncharacterized protein K02A2.6-like n=1 Tax=Trichogramma pretiosum TaxID=7493 RepID=UPI0006C99C0D|nr:uncharacterized protein K02A2.6-like [Trichogramma pretiosum]